MLPQGSLCPGLHAGAQAGIFPDLLIRRASSPRPSLTTILSYLGLSSFSNLGFCPLAGRRTGQAKQAGGQEAATCCHGSEPTYQSVHQVSLTRRRCLVA